MIFDGWSKREEEDLPVPMPTPQDIFNWAVDEFRKQHPDAIITGWEVVNEGDGPKIVFTALEPKKQ